HLNNSRLRVLALKKAERSDELILRMVEMDGQARRDVQITFASPLIAAREVDAQEMPLQEARVVRGALVTSFDPYQLRTFAVKVGRFPASTPPKIQAIKLPFDRPVAAKDGSKSATASRGFDGEGRALPAELLPGKINFGGISFALAPSHEGIPLAS